MAEQKNEQQQGNSTVFIDASGKIAGRLCSHAAKLLLNGNRVVIFNAESVLFSGSRKNIMSEWADRLNLGSVVHPKHGPFHPRTPDGILSRMVRGMLPRRKPSGSSALKKLRVYIGTPSEFAKAQLTDFEDSKATKPPAYYFPLGEIAGKIGWKGSMGSKNKS